MENLGGGGGIIRNLFRLLSSLLRALIKVSNALGMIGILLMLALISVDIFGRLFFNAPLPGVPGFVSLMMVCIVFLHLARTLELGQFIRSEGLIARLPPTISRVLDIIYDLVGACALITILIYSWDPMVNAWSSYEVEATGLIDVPVYPVRFIILVGSLATGMRFIGNACLGLYSLYSATEARSKH